jgi:hypothetical protein
MAFANSSLRGRRARTVHVGELDDEIVGALIGFMRFLAAAAPPTFGSRVRHVE